MRRHKGKLQQGYIYEASGSFFVRYYTTEIIDGHMQRVQRSHRLCDKDGKKYRSKKDQNVKQLRDEFMLGINSQTVHGPANSHDMAVADFWDKIYLPFIKANKRKSTVHGYEKIWQQHLKNHFDDKTLRQYRTPDGSQFLTALADGGKGLGRHTLAHIKSTASAIFSHAVNLGQVDSNPWRDAKCLGKVKEPEGTAHYTLEQATKMIAGLAGHPDCQAILALACFRGLRPGEISGLKWEDIDNTHIHLRRAWVLREEGELKTRIKAAADQRCSCGLPMKKCQRVPLTSVVAGLLDNWRKQSGNPSTGWVFPNGNGRPADLASLSRRVFRPVLESKGIKFKGLYPGRRGIATALTELTGDALASQQLLRHTDLSVTTKSYVQMIPEALDAGDKLLEQKVVIPRLLKSGAASDGV